MGTMQGLAKPLLTQTCVTPQPAVLVTVSQCLRGQLPKRDQGEILQLI